MADRWIGKYPDTIYGLGCFRRYKGGIWAELSLTQVQKEILEILINAKSEGIRPNNSRINSVIEICRILTVVSNDRFEKNPYQIVFRNGSFNLGSGLLLPHDKEDYAIASLPYDYDPDAEPKVWLEILSRLSLEDVLFLQEFFGYCLTKETKYEVAVWLTGPSGSGKSAIIEGMQAMAGTLAVQLSLSDMERSKFSLPLIVGKNIIFSTEQFTTMPTVIDNLNKIVSGETIVIEEKYEKPYNYKPHQKIIFASTEIPHIPPTDGFLRRFKFINIPPLHPDQRNINIKSLIKQEGPGILNWALKGLKRLMNRGHFDNFHSVISPTNQFVVAQNDVREFVATCCETGGSFKIQASSIYKAYSNWCLANERIPKSIKKIAQDWKNLGFTNTHVSGCSYWVGIRLKLEEDYEVEKNKYI